MTQQEIKIRISFIVNLGASSPVILFLDFYQSLEVIQIILDNACDSALQIIGGQTAVSDSGDR